MNARLLRTAAALVALALLAMVARRLGGGDSDFDFYVLALSWSPSYCAIEGDGADPAQCASGRPYAFVVHGLWPQYEKGYPRDCETSAAPSEALVRSMLDIMPAPGLVRHEWRSHGSCAGLSPDAYFETVRAARERVTVPAAYGRLDRWTTVRPADVERAFIAANPGLDAAMVAPVCGKRFLSEIRLCLTKTLEFRPCPEIDGQACRLDSAVMPPVRK